MKTYKIEVKETLSRIVSIEAKDEQEAVQKIEKLYKKEKIVLDSDDFVSKEIEVCKD
ncbi:DpnD/PcfM family protein [Capnocytophaga sp. ARDL2]|uniref:DpnD/PcfM family protein n=1 Tax=Capnocytophaga sp. ARDL2 TaxID=3238809 RepID=UPI0035578B0E